MRHLTILSIAVLPWLAPAIPTHADPVLDPSFITFGGLSGAEAIRQNPNQRACSNTPNSRFRKGATAQAGTGQVDG